MESHRPPNILYLHVHDAGRQVQPYGAPVPTPHLQQLAEQGVLYRQAFCANPTCSASRSALLTGTYPHCNGMLGLAHRGFRLNDYRWHLCHLLKSAGYHTALAGVQHLAHAATTEITELGYDEILTTASDFDQPVQAAADFFRSAKSRPFFLSVGFSAPHRDARESFSSNRPPPNPHYVRPPAILPDTPETRADFAAYSASMTSVDESMGRVLAALAEQGLAENTLVIATTDHGVAFPEMKCNLTDHGIGVYLIMRGPGGFTGGQVNDDLVSQIDIVPTVLEVAGIACPPHVQGRSMRQGPPRESIFAEVNVHAAIEPMRAVRTKRWKYIRRYAATPQRVLPNCDNSPSKTLWHEAGWAQQPVAAEELYDLMLDPMERRNLATDPAHEDTRADMAARLRTWQIETNDPILHGPLQLPPEAVVAPPHKYSPHDLS
ncbi:MAG: sulfatase [Opitutaceae bacterium]|nr:sulfatase [Cephaloticoccus sp.]MCP5529142.1 sulfatase [Opitutaceae bacterium]